jgi:hypothetical protein
MSLVVEAGQNYEERMAKKRSSDDHATRQYDTLKARVANCVRDRAMAACAKASDYPLFPNLDHARAQGRGDKTMAGYRFVTYLPFLGMSDDEIKRELFTALFNRSVTADEDLREIHKEDDWVDCVRGTTNKDEVVNKLDENLTKFLGRMTKPLHEIQPLSKPDESIGSTLGERSIVFFKVISDQISRGDGALLIDQPEDNVSNYRIVSDLSPSLNGLRDRRQVIFVTHNPLLVVNLDVDNVIFVKGKRDMAGGIRNEIQVTSGCLEDEENDILGIIARQMDGGRDAIQRRLNAYGDSA